MMQIPDGLGDFVPLVWSGLQFVCGVVVGGLLGGWIGYRWKRLELRDGRKREFRVFVVRLAERVAAGNPWRAADLHEEISVLLREACINVQGDLGARRRKELEKAWKDFAAIPHEELTPSPDGRTTEERRRAMRRGLDKMEGMLRPMEKIV